MEAALRWIDDLGLPPGARILEVGCGAGFATRELAVRGFSVESIDSSAEMVTMASDRLAAEGLADAARLRVGDAHELRWDDESFSVVLALGVLPWLHTPELGLREVARVLRPGGHAILTADNRLRLSLVLKRPFLTVIKSRPLAPLKRLWRELRRTRVPAHPAIHRRHSPLEVDSMLRQAGLAPQRRTTVGFGPFMLLERLGSERLGIRLHRALGGVAARHLSRVRRSGWHYMVSAQK
jgi:ubiquinone/menaquinone biosynthesis C-methylase UbiE